MEPLPLAQGLVEPLAQQLRRPQGDQRCSNSPKCAEHRQRVGSLIPLPCLVELCCRIVLYRTSSYSSYILDSDDLRCLAPIYYLSSSCYCPLFPVLVRCGTLYLRQPRLGADLVRAAYSP